MENRKVKGKRCGGEIREVAFEEAIASEPTKPLIEVIKESLEESGELKASC